MLSDADIVEHEVPNGTCTNFRLSVIKHTGAGSDICCGPFSRINIICKTNTQTNIFVAHFESENSPRSSRILCRRQSRSVNCSAHGSTQKITEGTEHYSKILSLNNRRNSNWSQTTSRLLPLKSSYVLNLISQRSRWQRAAADKITNLQQDQPKPKQSYRNKCRSSSSAQ